MGTLTGRYVYGRLRAMAIRDFGLNWVEADDDAFWIVGVATLLSFLVWPVALVLCGMFVNPPKTPKEIEAERDRLAAQLKKMETDAGL